FGGGDVLGDAGQPETFGLAQAIVPEAKRSDQRPVNDEVGITADRRGEVGIAVEIETEMAVIVWRIFGLGLRAQHHFADLLDIAGLAGLTENAVEIAGTHAIGLLDRNIER